MSTQSIGSQMFGQMYDRALRGERCWIRHDDGGLAVLPVARWLGGHGADTAFDTAVLTMCDGPTIELGCGPGRLVAQLIRRGVPALGIDQSATAIQMARRSGAVALHGDVFGPLPAMGCWRTVLLVDGNVGMGGDASRVLARAAQLLSCGGRCVAEFSSAATRIQIGWVRLESDNEVGPWFRWATVGLDSAARLAQGAGLALTSLHPIGDRVVVQLASADPNQGAAANVQLRPTAKIR